MDVIAALPRRGQLSGCAAICGTHKTVKRIIELHEAGGRPVEHVPRVRNCDEVADLVAKHTSGRISAKRLLPAGAMPGRPGTSGAWSPMRSECGGRGACGGGVRGARR
jgi:hypothetical protein